uniref:Sulfotransferase n=1 Tax=Pelodiscus sinensis TaxID=13735 RepID=K7FJ12_PELSI
LSMFKEYFQYKGISFPELIYSAQGLREAENGFRVRDDDIFNVTYQKSGTVWMLEILSLIRSNGDPSWCRTVPNWERGPWYETILGLRMAQGNRSPRIISSHLPIQLFAKSFFRSKAKVVYTVRNPKDVLVSLYHFAQIFRPYKEPGRMDQFLERFLEGDGECRGGGGWHCSAPTWRAPGGGLATDPRPYSPPPQDLRGSIQRICRFLGRELEDQALDAVVANASFQAMKQNKMSNFSLSPSFLLDQSKKSFLRKGGAGPGNW